MRFATVEDVELDVTRPYLRIDDDPTTIYDLDVDEYEEKVIVDEAALARGTAQVSTVEMIGLRNRMNTRDQLVVSYEQALMRFR